MKQTLIKLKEEIDGHNHNYSQRFQIPSLLIDSPSKRKIKI